MLPLSSCYRNPVRWSWRPHSRRRWSLRRIFRFRVVLRRGVEDADGTVGVDDTDVVAGVNDVGRVPDEIAGRDLNFSLRRTS